ncbi:MAG TPA: DUF4276 family protein [Polyangium sp.]|nr:DUF4276 family protein [Polyangium sp.]
MTSIRFGLITEDETDANAVGILVRRIALSTRASTPGLNKYWGKGCARIRKKAEAKMAEMMESGCQAVIIVHDLDRSPQNGQLNNEMLRRAELENVPVPQGLQRHICIPIEELEAWFWADEETVKLATHGNAHAHAHASPHLLAKPKEQFERLSRGANGKSRYNTNKNPELAEKLNLAICEKRCPSFHALANFIRQTLSS